MEVTLQNDRGKPKKFPLDHAERILNMRVSGWTLNDKDYDFVDGELKKKKKKKVEKTQDE